MTQRERNSDSRRRAQHGPARSTAHDGEASTAEQVAARILRENGVPQPAEDATNTEAFARMDTVHTGAGPFVISIAAELAGMHAQTLRTYDRLGLVTPQRTSGGGRRYSNRDVELLREVQRLSQDEGVNLAGIKRIIDLTNQVEALQQRVSELAAEVAALRANQRRELLPAQPSTALVVWQPRNKRR